MNLNNIIKVNGMDLSFIKAVFIRVPIQYFSQIQVETLSNINY